jgi:hypothetical protein
MNVIGLFIFLFYSLQGWSEETSGDYSAMVKKSAPFSIYQATNPAFVRHLSQDGKISREYKPKICVGEGTWAVEKNQLKTKEKIRCYKDMDHPDQGYEKAWWQKASFTISDINGELSLMGVLADSNQTFQLN